MGRSGLRLPYATFSRDFIPDQSLTDLLAGGTAPKGHGVYTVNGIVIGDLAEGWRESVSQAAPKSLTDVELRWVEHVARGYIFKRAAFVHGIPWGDPERKPRNKRTAGIRNRVDNLKHAAQALLDAAEIYSRSDQEIWRRLEALEPKNVHRDDVYPVITTLVNRVVRVQEQLEDEFKLDGALPQKGPLFSLIDGVASLFTAHNWPVSAAKISRANAAVVKVSPFVEFLFALMREVPSELREHAQTAHNKWALSTAVSEAKNKLRKHGWKPDLGAFRDFAASISPKT
jgi:hypothetical protein